MENEPHVMKSHQSKHSVAEAAMSGDLRGLDMVVWLFTYVCDNIRDLCVWLLVEHTYKCIFALVVLLLLVVFVLVPIWVRYYSPYRSVPTVQPEDFIGVWNEGLITGQHPTMIRLEESGMTWEHGPNKANMVMEGHELVGTASRDGIAQLKIRCTLEGERCLMALYLWIDDEWKYEVTTSCLIENPDIFIDDSLDLSPFRGIKFGKGERVQTDTSVDFDSSRDLGLIVDESGFVVDRRENSAALAQEVPISARIVRVNDQIIPPKTSDAYDLIRQAKSQGSTYSISWRSPDVSDATELIDGYISDTLNVLIYYIIGFPAMMGTVGVYSWWFSECGHGTPYWLGAVIVIYVSSTWFVQHRLVGHYRKLGLKNVDDSVKTRWLKRATVRSWGEVNKYTVSPDAVPLLLLCGITEALDSSTDGLMPGQVAACKHMMSTPLETYVHSFRPLGIEVVEVLEHVTKHYGLGVLYAVTAFVGSSSQILLAIYRTFHLKHAASLSSYTEDRKAYAAAAEKFGSLALVSDSVGLTYVAKLWRITAADMAKMSEGLGTGDDAGCSQEERSRSKAKQLSTDALIAFEMTITKVVLEAAPALYLATTYFAAMFDTLTPTALAVTSLSCMMSLATIVQRGMQCLRTKTWATMAVGVTLLLISMILLVKFLMTFVCTSRFFIIFTFACSKPGPDPMETLRV